MFLVMIVTLVLLIFIPMGIGYIVLILAEKEENTTSKKIGKTIGWIIIIGSIALLFVQLAVRPYIKHTQKSSGQILKP